jgi:hypothetical protein
MDAYSMAVTPSDLRPATKTNLDIAPLSAIHGLRSISPSVDVIWLKDESLEDTENLPPPAVLAQEIVEQLEAALEEFRSVEEVLSPEIQGS